jgi:endo-1,4-beta-xylanase
VIAAQLTYTRGLADSQYQLLCVENGTARLTANPPRLFNYTGEFSVNGNAYLALYGWTTNPLVEWYVIESMGQHNPSDNASATQYGTVESDGGLYEIWQKERINAPSIEGDKTNFQQYWSVRTKRHVGGTINTGNHFRAWQALGLKLGTQLYMDIVIEGQLGAGSANITVGTPPSTPVPESPTPTYRSEKAQGTCPYTRPSTSSRPTSTSTTSTRRTTTSSTRRTTTTTSTRRTTSSTRRPIFPTRTRRSTTTATARTTGFNSTEV